MPPPRIIGQPTLYRCDTSRFERGVSLPRPPPAHAKGCGASPPQASSQAHRMIGRYGPSTVQRQVTSGAYHPRGPHNPVAGRIVLLSAALAATTGAAAKGRHRRVGLGSGAAGGGASAAHGSGARRERRHNPRSSAVLQQAGIGVGECGVLLPWSRSVALSAELKTARPLKWPPVTRRARRGWLLAWSMSSSA